MKTTSERKKYTAPLVDIYDNATAADFFIRAAAKRAYMPGRKIKALLIAPGEKGKYIYVDATDDGFIRFFKSEYSENYFFSDVICVMSDSAMQEKKLFTCNLCNYRLYGDVLFIGADRYGNRVSLNKKQCVFLEKFLFKQI